MSQTDEHRSAASAPEAVSPRRALLDAVLEVFTERGYGNASVAEIAARSGVGVGSLFRHYGGKSGLYLALWEENQEEQERQAAVVMAQARGRGTEDRAALFLAGARAYLEGAWERRRIGRLLLEDDTPAGLDAIRRRRDREWVRRNARLLGVEESHAGQARMMTLTAVVSGAVRELGECPDSAQAGEFIDEVCGVMARLLGAP